MRAATPSSARRSSRSSSSVEAELADVDRALERLDQGTYGRCDACGEAIAEERLEVVPAARFCVQHQADVET